MRPACDGRPPRRGPTYTLGKHGGLPSASKLDVNAVVVAVVDEPNVPVVAVQRAGGGAPNISQADGVPVHVKRSRNGGDATHPQSEVPGRVDDNGVLRGALVDREQPLPR